MSEPRRHRDCGDELAAYALGALEPAEAEAVRAHLETCPACRDELAALQQVVDTLPLSAPAHRTPARLRRRVLAEVHGRATPDRPARRWAVTGWARPALAAAAILVIAALVVLRLTPGSVSAYRRYAAHVSGPGAAQLGVRAGRGRLVLTGFAPPPSGDIYEVWVKHGTGAPEPTNALFSVTRGGSADVAVPGGLPHGTTVMVTPEPPGGSRVPTHPPVLTVSVS